MKRKSVRRILTVCLIFALIFTCVNTTPLIRAEAEPAADTVEEIDENDAVQSESDNAEEVADVTEDTGFTDGSEAVDGTESMAQGSENPTSDTEGENDSELLSPSFDASMDVDGVNIHVTAPEGVLLDGCSLKVEMVSDEDVKAKIADAIESEKNIAKSYTYDIKVLDVDGNEVQPDLTYGNVNVSFELNEVTDTNVEPSVYHVDDNYNVTELKMLDEASLVEDEKILSVETDGFSYYIVEFTYADKQYVLDGDTEVNLNDVLKAVEVNGTVNSAVSSDSELFSVSQKDDSWYVKAEKKFDSQECLTVTVNGLEYKVAVTYEDADGAAGDTSNDSSEQVDEDASHENSSDDETIEEDNAATDDDTSVNEATYKLSVSNTLSGNGCDRNQEFNYELQFTGNDMPSELSYTIKESGESDVSDTMEVSDGIATFSLRDGQTIVFEGVQQNMTYNVQELNGETYGYTVSYENQAGTMDADVHVKVLNNRMVIVPTSADTNTGAMMLLVGVGVAAVLLEVKKYRVLKK